MMLPFFTRNIYYNFDWIKKKWRDFLKKKYCERDPKRDDINPKTFQILKGIQKCEGSKNIERDPKME